MLNRYPAISAIACRNAAIAASSIGVTIDTKSCRAAPARDIDGIGGGYTTNPPPRGETRAHFR